VLNARASPGEGGPISGNERELSAHPGRPPATPPRPLPPVSRPDGTGVYPAPEPAQACDGHAPPAARPDRELTQSLGAQVAGEVHPVPQRLLHRGGAIRCDAAGHEQTRVRSPLLDRDAVAGEVGKRREIGMWQSRAHHDHRVEMVLVARHGGGERDREIGAGLLGGCRPPLPPHFGRARPAPRRWCSRVGCSRAGPSSCGASPRAATRVSVVLPAPESPTTPSMIDRLRSAPRARGAPISATRARRSGRADRSLR
jgi:hypothetical protein